MYSRGNNDSDINYGTEFIDKVTFSSKDVYKIYYAPFIYILARVNQGTENFKKIISSSAYRLLDESQKQKYTELIYRVFPIECVKQIDLLTSELKSLEGMEKKTLINLEALLQKNRELAQCQRELNELKSPLKWI